MHLYIEQQVVDCDKVEEVNLFGPGAGGCNGGNHYYVWQYLSNTGGSQPTSAYGAYTSGTTGTVSIFFKNIIEFRAILNLYTYTDFNV